jgi:hypothetical protein
MRFPLVLGPAVYVIFGDGAVRGQRAPGGEFLGAVTPRSFVHCGPLRPPVCAVAVGAALVLRVLRLLMLDDAVPTTILIRVPYYPIYLGGCLVGAWYGGHHLGLVPGAGWAV